MSEKSRYDAYWYGKPIEDHSKEELLQLVIRCLDRLRENRETQELINNIRGRSRRIPPPPPPEPVQKGGYYAPGWLKRMFP